LSLNILLCNFPMSVHGCLTTRYLKRGYHASRDDYFSLIYSKVGEKLFIPMPPNPTKAKLIFASLLSFSSTEKFQKSHVLTREKQAYVYIDIGKFFVYHIRMLIIHNCKGRFEYRTSRIAFANFLLPKNTRFGVSMYI
jgi:hypothetical protein